MYDAVVIGGRCAGASVAYLLASGGMAVFCCDASDPKMAPLSTHSIHLTGFRILDAWGLKDRFLELGSIPFREMRLDLFGHKICGLPHGAQAPHHSSYCVRREKLDPFLADAAVKAGAEVQFLTKAVRIEKTGDRWRVTVLHHDKYTEIEARHLIAADGMNSNIAKLLGIEFSYFERSKTFSLYNYYDTDLDGTAEIFIRRDGVQACVPTTNDEMIHVIQCPISHFPSYRLDQVGFITGAITRLSKLLDSKVKFDFDDKYRAAPNQPSFIRNDLETDAIFIGDSWSHKDSITAQGITDAFKDADAISRILLGGGSSSDLLCHKKERQLSILPEIKRAMQLASFVSPTSEKEKTLSLVSKSPNLCSLLLGIDAMTVTTDHFEAELENEINRTKTRAH